MTPLRFLAKDARKERVATMEEPREGAALMLLW